MKYEEIWSSTKDQRDCTISKSRKDSIPFLSVLIKNFMIQSCLIMTPPNAISYWAQIKLKDVLKLRHWVLGL